MEFLFMLEDSWLGQLVSSTIWGYPIFLSFHALGMGVVVGISVMFALRIVGFANSVPITAIAPYWRLAQAGFVVNLLSGVALFLGSAASLGLNWAFYAKIGMLFCSLYLTYRMFKLCFKEQVEITTGDRLLAYVALGSWVLTIIFGRLIGYIF